MRSRSRSSSKSPEKEKPPPRAEEEEEEMEEVTEISEETNSPTDEHRRRVRRLQLREEGAAFRQLALEKGSYFDKPNSHPRYIETWNKFWIENKEKFAAKGIDISSIDLTKDWENEWRKFVEEENKEKMNSEKAEISKKWNEKLRDPSSLPDPSTDPDTEIITLSESEDSNTDRPETPPPPQIFSGLAQTEQEDVKPQKVRRYSPPPPEDVNVLNLLNLLVQLQEKTLLSCGEKIHQLRAVALNQENCEFGSSQELLNNIDCFNLMDSAGEALKVKQTAKLVPEIHSHVVKIVLSQISLFLQKSSCQKSDILEIESFSPIRTEDSGVLKMSISKNIEKELQSSGKIVSQQEFNSLVEAEYVRVKHNMRPSNINVKQQPQPPLRPPSTDQSELFSAYSIASPGPSQPGIDWDNIMRGITNIQQSENNQNIQSEPSVSPHLRNSFKKIPDQNENKPFGQNDQMSDDELAIFLKNSKNLPEDQKNILSGLVRELEDVDPKKIERIKKILYLQQSR